MAKLGIWLITLAGLAIPLLLSVTWLSIISKSSIPSRYAEQQELGGDPILHDSYFYIEMFGQRYGMNSSIYPPLIVLVGVMLIIAGTFFALHVNTGMSWTDTDAS